MAANSIAKLAVIITGDASPLRTATQQAAQAVGAFSGQMQAASGLSFLGVSASAAAATAGITAVAAAAAAFAKTGIEAASQIEQLQIAFEVMTGSASQATALIDDMRKLSAETPLELPDVQRAGKTLLAMGEPIGAIVSDMKMLGDIAAGTGQPLNELAQVFGQVMQAGKLTGNELRQFNERGVPLLTQLADQMGVSKTKIREMVEQSQISSLDVVKAFEAMTGAGGRFADMMERQTDTLLGQWNKFKENLTNIAATVMAPIAAAMKEILTSFNEVLDMVSKAMGISRTGDFNTANKAQVDAMREQEVARVKAEQAAAKAADEAKKHQDELQKRGEAVAKAMRTPLEVMRDSFAEMTSLLNAGVISWDTFNRGIEDSADKFAKASAAAKELRGLTSGVGAAERFTTQAFSAVQSALRQKEASDATAKQQLAVEQQIRQEVAGLRKDIAGVKPVSLKVARLN